MARALVVVVVGLIVWLGGGDDAHACKFPGSLFEFFDQADKVAVTRVTSVAPPGRKLGRVQLHVTEALEGTSVGERLTVRFGNSSCDPRVRKTRAKVLVLMRADGSLAGKYHGYIVAPSEALLSSLRAWSAASTAEDRVAVLIDAMSGPEERLGWEAVVIAESSDFRSTLDEDRLAQLTDAVAAFRAAHAP